MRISNESQLEPLKFVVTLSLLINVDLLLTFEHFYPLSISVTLTRFFAVIYTTSNDVFYISNDLQSLLSNHSFVDWTEFQIVNPTCDLSSWDTVRRLNPGRQSISKDLYFLLQMHYNSRKEVLERRDRSFSSLFYLRDVQQRHVAYGMRDL